MPRDTHLKGSGVVDHRAKLLKINDLIVAVDGVDVTYIGPADLSASYGHLGNMSHPTVQTAIDRVYEATKNAGKATGIHLGSGKTIKERIDKGYNFITIGNDLTYLKSAVVDHMKSLGI